MGAGFGAVLVAGFGVVPVAAGLAAGLLVWIAWHENRTPQARTPNEIATAKMEPPATPPPSVTRDGRQSASADETARLSKDQGAIGGAGPAKSAPQAGRLKQFEKTDSRRRVARPESRADKETGAHADTALDSLSAANRAQNQPAQDAKARVAGALSQTVEVQTPAGNAQPQNQQVQQTLQAQQNQLNEQKTSGPNPSRVAEAAKKRKSESPATGYRAAAAAPQAASFHPRCSAAPFRSLAWFLSPEALPSF